VNARGRALATMAVHAFVCVGAREFTRAVVLERAEVSNTGIVLNRPAGNIPVSGLKLAAA